MTNFTTTSTDGTNMFDVLETPLKHSSCTESGLENVYITPPPAQQIHYEIFDKTQQKTQPVHNVWLMKSIHDRDRSNSAPPPLRKKKQQQQQQQQQQQHQAVTKPSDSLNWRSRSANSSPANSPISNSRAVSPSLGPIGRPPRRRSLFEDKSGVNIWTKPWDEINNLSSLPSSITNTKLNRNTDTHISFNKSPPSNTMYHRNYGVMRNNDNRTGSKSKHQHQNPNHNHNNNNEKNNSQVETPVPKGTMPYGEGGPGGTLHQRAQEYFERAYGLNGRIAEDHTVLKQIVQAEVGCSVRAVMELFYGFSYSDLLEDLRCQVRLYPRKPTVVGNKNRSKEKRMAELEALAKILDPNATL